MYLHRQSVFLETLARNPYRIACSVFFALLNMISGITTNTYCFNEARSEFMARSMTAAPLSFSTVFGALLWQIMLCCAARFGRSGGMRMTAAFVAISLESFVAGFSVSELLFHYGGKGTLPALLLTVFYCMTGVMLRIYLFLPASKTQNMERGQRREVLFSIPIIRTLVIIILLQGIALPLLLCS